MVVQLHDPPIGLRASHHSYAEPRSRRELFGIEIEIHQVDVAGGSRHPLQYSRQLRIGLCDGRVDVGRVRGTLAIVYGTRATPFTTGHNPVGDERLGAIVTASGAVPLRIGVSGRPGSLMRPQRRPRLCPESCRSDKSPVRLSPRR